MSHTEQQRQQAREMSQRSQELAAQRRQDRFDDFMDLVSMGTSVDEAVKRIGTTLTAINRQAYRHGRTDIGRLTNFVRYL